jgi:O-antigen/teichoic acid export membrane protein
MTEPLGKRTLRALKWSYIASGSNIILQVTLTIVLARLLNPREFGLMAMALAVSRFGSYLGQMGLGHAIIQKLHLSDEDVRAGFTASMFLGIVATGVLWIGAPLARYLFDDADVVPVIRWLGLSFIFHGAANTALSLLRRSMSFREIAIIELVAYAIGYGVPGIVLAYHGFGVWSLVIASMGQAIFMCIGAYLRMRHSVRMVWRWQGFVNLMSYGTRMSGVSLLEAGTAVLDTLAVGRYKGAEALGIYNRGYMIAYLPLYHFTTSSTRVLFPSFSKLQENIVQLRATYLDAVRLFGYVLLPACSAAFVLSDEIVIVLLGENWTEAVPILKVFSFAMPFAMLVQLSGIAFDATARLNMKLAIQIFHLAFLAVLLFLFKSFSLVSFAIAVAIGEFFRYILHNHLLRDVLGITVRETAKAFFPSLITSILVVIVCVVTREASRSLDAPALALLAYCMLIAIMIQGVSLRLPMHRECRRIIRNRIVQTAQHQGHPKTLGMLIAKLLGGD